MYKLEKISWKVLISELKHLQLKGGKHDQKTHGRRGGSGGGTSFQSPAERLMRSDAKKVVNAQKGGIRKTDAQTPHRATYRLSSAMESQTNRSTLNTNMNKLGYGSDKVRPREEKAWRKGSVRASVIKTGLVRELEFAIDTIPPKEG